MHARLERLAVAALGEDAHLHLAVGVLEPGGHQIRAPEQRGGAVQLDRPSRRGRPREQPAVVGGEVDVELLDVQEPPEAVCGQREELAEVVARIQRQLIEPRGEEISRRVVRRAIAGQLRHRQGARLEDAVVDVLVRQRHVIPAPAQPELREQLAQPRARCFPPSVLLRGRARKIEVDRTRPAVLAAAMRRKQAFE